MMQHWHEDMVRFMKDASEYGTYNRELARLLVPGLTKKSRICDAGCGLGYLALELAPHVGVVSAVDRNPDAIRVLSENCGRFGITNVQPVCGEIGRVPPEKPYDAMVFCFFGGIHEILRVAKSQCAGTVFLVTRNYSRHRFSVGSHATGSYGRKSAGELLRQMGIPYEETLRELEFGQPFRNMEDVRRFFEMYCQDGDLDKLSDEFLRGRVGEIRHEAYRFYMPHKRKIALIKFETKDIPGSFGAG